MFDSDRGRGGPRRKKVVNMPIDEEVHFHRWLVGVLGEIRGYDDSRFKSILDQLGDGSGVDKIDFNGSAMLKKVTDGAFATALRLKTREISPAHWLYAHLDLISKPLAEQIGLSDVKRNAFQNELEKLIGQQAKPASF